MEEKWTMKRPHPAAADAAKMFGIEEVTANVLLNRGLRNRREFEEYLYGGTHSLHDPMLLADMDKACRIIHRKIQERKKICIVGDYDIDGIMASYILRRGLLSLGVQADVRLPDRVKDGYGINPGIVREAYEHGTDTIITCDNGISAHEAVAAAMKMGMTVIVTDHHAVVKMPDADAVVNPQRADDRYPNKNLCGAAVAWKLVQALGGDRGGDLIEYACFATVGDVMDLTGENRIIVRQGLERLRRTGNIGMRALMDACGIAPEKTTAYHIGYVLGPCLNASGRLRSANIALGLLESADADNAAAIAKDLRDLNEKRREMTTEAVEKGMEAIRAADWKNDPVYVVYLPDIHESIAGIAAGRLREQTGHPVFVLAKSGGIVKGSGRSIETYNMIEGLARAESCLLKYGGHRTAAGLSLEEGMIGEFRKAVNENCSLSEDDLATRVKIDAVLAPEDATLKLAEELSMLEPFGKANEKPLFGAKHIYCEEPRIIGKNGNVLKCRIRLQSGFPENSGTFPRGGAAIDALCFHDAETLRERLLASPVATIAYELDVNEWNGVKSPQIVIRHFR